MKYSDINPYRTKYTHLLVDNVSPGCTMIFNRTLADLILKSDNGREILSRGYRQHACYLRSEADEVEAQYNENKKKKILRK